jgi:hypothetical protein
MLVTGTVDFTLEAGRYYFLEMFTGAWGKYDSYWMRRTPSPRAFQALSV